jgi:hypothetical protein
MTLLNDGNSIIKNISEQSGVAVKLFGRWPIRILTDTPVILTENSDGFAQYRRANSGIVLQIRPRPLCCKLFPVHRSSTNNVTTRRY